MKTKVTIIAIAAILMNVAVATAQIQLGEQERFAFSFYSTYGLDAQYYTELGADIEFQGFIYAKAGVSINPTEEGFFDIHGGVGPRFTLGREERISIYTGFRGGVVFRNGAPNPIGGVELGAEFLIDNFFLVGATANYMYHGDLKAVYRQEVWAPHAGIKIGFLLN